MNTTDRCLLSYISHLSECLGDRYPSDQYSLKCDQGHLIVKVAHFSLAEECVGLSHLLLGSGLNLKVILQDQRTVFELST